MADYRGSGWGQVNDRRCTNSANKDGKAGCAAEEKPVLAGRQGRASERASKQASKSRR